MANTHRHRPSQAVDATFIFSGSKSGLLQKRARICFITGAGMLSCHQHISTSKITAGQPTFGFCSGTECGKFNNFGKYFVLDSVTVLLFQSR